MSENKVPLGSDHLPSIVGVCDEVRAFGAQD